MKMRNRLPLVVAPFYLLGVSGPPSASAHATNPKWWPLVAYKPQKRNPKELGQDRVGDPSTTVPVNGGLRYVTADPAKNHYVENPLGAAYRPARKLMDEGRVEEVIHYLETTKSSNSGNELFEPTDCLLADAYLQQNRPADAFAVLQPYLGTEEDDFGSDNVVRASVAAALLGRNYLGQEDYVTRYFQFNCKNVPLAKVRDAQKRLVYISAVAATLEREYDAKRLLYAIIALKAVPRDPLATYMAVSSYISCGKASEAKKLLDMVTLCSDENVNKTIEYQRGIVDQMLKKQ